MRRVTFFRQDRVIGKSLMNRLDDRPLRLEISNRDSVVRRFARFDFVGHVGEVAKVPRDNLSSRACGRFCNLLFECHGRPDFLGWIDSELKLGSEWEPPIRCLILIHCLRLPYLKRVSRSCFDLLPRAPSLVAASAIQSVLRANKLSAMLRRHQ